MNLKPVVVGIGELLWDVFPTGKRAGGAPINFVYHASQLGAQGYAISAVGDDELGREILQELDLALISAACFFSKKSLTAARICSRLRDFKR